MRPSRAVPCRDIAEARRLVEALHGQGYRAAVAPWRAVRLPHARAARRVAVEIAGDVPPLVLRAVVAAVCG